MEEQIRGGKPLRRRAGFIRSVFYSLGFLVLRLWEGILHDLERMWDHFRLFFGITLTTIGLLNFSSGAYCDRAVPDAYNCVRPSTYYYYSWETILVIVLGVTLIILWFLSRKKK